MAATSSALSWAEMAVKFLKSPTSSVAFTVFTGRAMVWIAWVDEACVLV